MRLLAGPVIPFAKKNTNPIRFRMAKSDTGSSADIYIYDIIGDSWDGTTAKQFAADLKELGSPKTLNVFINSPGGVISDGVSIYNVLRRHAARKIVQIDGLAASIASIVAMAGDEIKMASNGMMMIHDPWGFAIGTSAEMRKAAEALDKMRGTLIDTYAKRTGGTANKIGDMMAAETWFTAEEAIDEGFADSITEEVEMAALAKYDLSTFHNLPRSLKELKGREGISSTDHNGNVFRGNTITNSGNEHGIETGKEPPVKTEESGTAPAPHPAIARAAAHLRRRNLGPALTKP